MKKLLQRKPLFWAAVFLFMLVPGADAQESGAYGPSPDSKSLVRSIQNPVNYNTGVVNVQAPLYTVQAEGATVPIALNYQTSGIRVGDRSTSAGLGWRLSSGGKITRIVKKYPDEKNRKTCFTNEKDPFNTKNESFNNGWIGNYIFSVKSKIDQVLGLEKSSDWDSCSQMYFDFDTEPDIFYFEIPGKAGVFVLDNNGVAHTIPYQDINITFTRSGDEDNNYFTIKDNGGNSYKFGTKPESREMTKIMRRNDANGSDVDMTYNSTWWLDEIKPFAGETVSFTYAKSVNAKTILTKERFQAGIYEKKDGKYKMTDFQHNYITSSEVSPSYLKEIKWNKGRVEFYYATKKSAALDYSFELLERIKTFDYGYSPINVFYLSYSFFNNGQARLDGVMEEFGSDMQSLYKFRYAATQIPDKYDCYYDHWGYYNGMDDTSYHDYMPSIEDGTVSIKGHTREPKLTYARSGILRSVETGNRKTMYEYELNEVGGSGLADKPFGGLRIKYIIDFADEKFDTVRRFTYTLPDGKRSSGKAYENKFMYYDKAEDNKITVYSRCINNLFDFGGNHMSYSRVTEYMPDGSYNVYNYDEGTACEDPEWDTYPAVSVSFDRRLQMGHMAPPTSYFWRRGLLTSQEAYTASGALVSKTENQYAFGPARKVIECMYPYEQEKCLFLYKWVSEPVFLTKTINHSTRYNNRTETAYEYDRDRMLPVKVITTDSAGVKYETTTRYSGDYKELKTLSLSSKTDMLAALKYMIAGNALNIPIETVNYRKGYILSATLNMYRGITDNTNTTGVVPDKVMSLLLKQGLAASAFTQSAVNATNGIYFKSDSRYKAEEYYDQYDGIKLLSSHKENGMPQSVVYGYGGKLPVATVANAVCSVVPSQNQVIYESFEDAPNKLECSFAKSGDYVNYAANGIYYLKLKSLKTGDYVISYWYLPTGKTKRSDWVYKETELFINSNTPDFAVYTTGGQYYDEVRVMPRFARMTTTTYRPGVGKTSETDINGNTTYYEYNKFRLLKTVMDNDGIKVRSLVYDNYTSNQ